MYYPLDYATNVKHRGKKFIFRTILQEELMFWALATLWVAAAPVWQALATGFFLLSFWCIYEQGYIENDNTALRYEGELGKVPQGFAYTASTEFRAWIWALALAACGTTLLAWPGTIGSQAGAVAIQFCVWLAVLVFTRVAFYVYNRLAPPSRPAMYAILQACRTFAVLAFAGADVIGQFLLAAHMLARMLPYYFYRYATPSDNQTFWPHMPVYTVRLCIFVLLTLGFAAAQREPEVLVQEPTLVMLAWCVFRARQELRKGLTRIQFLDRG